MSLPLVPRWESTANAQGVIFVRYCKHWPIMLRGVPYAQWPNPLMWRHAGWYDPNTNLVEFKHEVKVEGRDA